MPPANHHARMVDTHSHIGAANVVTGTSAIHPDVRIVDAIDVYSDTFRKARTWRVTTVKVMPKQRPLSASTV